MPGKQGRPTEEEVRAEIGSLMESTESRERERIDQAMEDLYWGEDAVTWPKNTPPEAKVEVHSSEAAQQYRLLRGMMDERPRVRVFADGENLDVRKRAAAVESFDNAIFPILEMQADERVSSLELEDTHTFGRGVSALELFPDTIAQGPEPPSDFLDHAANKGYLKARESFRKRLTTGDMRLPYQQRHVYARNFWWSKDRDLPWGMNRAVELRVRNAQDILQNPLYKEGLTELRRAVLKIAEKDAVAAAGLRVSFLVYQTNDWTSYFLLGGEPDWDSQDDRQETAQYSLWREQVVGEVALQMPNPLGRPSYTLSHAFTSNTRQAGRKSYGVYYLMRHLIRGRTHVNSWRMARYKQFALPSAVSTSGPTMVNGVMVDTQTRRDGTRRLTTLDAGGGQTISLDYGQNLQFLVPPGGGPDEEKMLVEFLQSIERLGVPSALFQGAGSGYEYESIANTVLAGHKVVVNNFAWGHLRKVLLLHRIVRLLRDPQYVLVKNRASSRHAAWVTLDPDVLDLVGWNLEPLFAIKKPQNLAAMLQNYLRGTEGPGAPYTRERGRELFLDEEESAQIEIEKLVQDWGDEPDVKQVRTQRALQQMLSAEDQQQAAQMATFSLAQVLQTSAPIAAALQKLIPAGSPGWQHLQDALGAAPLPAPGLPTPGSVLGPATAANPPPNMAMPGVTLPQGQRALGPGQGAPQGPAPGGGLPGGMAPGTASGLPGGARQQGGV